MSDDAQADQPIGSCPVCWRRDPYHPQVCDPCRSWLDGLLGDIRIRAEELAQPQAPVRDVRIAPIRGRDGYAIRDPFGNLVLRWRDPVANQQPAAPVPARSTQPRVSGAHERPAPINLTLVDLTLPAWPGSRGPYVRALMGLDDDQIGDLSLATTLNTWTVDWITRRGMREHRPEPSVEVLTGWLRDRLEWACDEHDEIEGFAADIHVYRSALRRMLGLTERPDYKDGVACPKCKGWGLEQRNGSLWVECSLCPAMLSPTEYQQLVHKQAERYEAEGVSAA